MRDIEELEKLVLIHDREISKLEQLVNDLWAGLYPLTRPEDLPYPMGVSVMDFPLSERQPDCDGEACEVCQ